MSFLYQLFLHILHVTFPSFYLLLSFNLLFFILLTFLFLLHTSYFSPVDLFRLVENEEEEEVAQKKGNSKFYKVKIYSLGDLHLRSRSLSTMSTSEGGTVN